MLKFAKNQMVVDLDLEAVSPLLIKDGRMSDDQRQKWEPDKKKREQMPTAIPISRNSVEEIGRAVKGEGSLDRCSRDLRFYLPGSSLKGAWRSHLERTLRGLTSEEDGMVCDPLDDEKDDAKQGPCISCSTVLEKRKNDQGFDAYKQSCLICRIFGNTVTGSRLKISDGVNVKEGVTKLVQREHVALNRQNGQVTRGPLKFYAIQEEKFKVTLTLRNFELRHLKLVGILLADLGGERVPVGSGKSKGYGKVKAHIGPIQLTHYGLESPGPVLRGWEGKEDEIVFPDAWKVQFSEWEWNQALTPPEFFKQIQGISMNWAKVPRLASRV